jgi:hypothetical protein
MIFPSVLAVSAALAVLVAPAAATPAPTARDVWAPKVLYPHAGTTWYRGQVRLISSVSLAALTHRDAGAQRDVGPVERTRAHHEQALPNFPVPRPRGPGRVAAAYVVTCRSPRVRPLTAHAVVLADQLDPRAGYAEVTVPWVMNGNYSVNVWGDSGNVGVCVYVLVVFAISHIIHAVLLPDSRWL